VMAQWGNTFAAQYRCFLAEAFHSGGRALPHSYSEIQPSEIQPPEKKP
jgi:hypothetical protein